MPAKKNQHYFLFAVLLSIVLLNACHNFYKAVPASADNASQKAASVDSLKLQNRYFVLRNGSQAYYMNKIVLSSDKKFSRGVSG